jgi:predicted protein tyrosine phosphatase
VVAKVHALREKSWPNARMIAFADEALGSRRTASFNVPS